MSKKIVVQLSFIIVLVYTIISNVLFIVKDVSKLYMQESLNINFFYNLSSLISMVRLNVITITLALIIAFGLWGYLKEEIKRLDGDIKNFKSIIRIGVGAILVINSIVAISLLTNNIFNLISLKVPTGAYLPLVKASAIEVICYLVQILFGVILVVKSKIKDKTFHEANIVEIHNESIVEEL